ncbi:MAG: potassium/proton antiporter [Bauldia sp.]|nr:potassium/proton antiporter [Bauldia sp.]
MTAMNLAILVGAVLVIVAIFTSVLSFRIGAPLLLIFLALGLGAGEEGLGIQFDNAPAAYFIGTIALALILFDSGFSTPFHTLRAAAFPAASLATAGVLLTTGLVGAAAHFLFALEWTKALLMGAIVSSTDAAAVFFLLRAGGINLRERIRATLEVESSSNDPMAILLTIGFVELVLSGGEGNPALYLLGDLAIQVFIGTAMGLAGGFLIRLIIDRTDLDSGLYPIIFLSLALAVFGATALLHGSGFLAVYIAGLFAGNSRMRHAIGLRKFSQALTWLSQIAMFLTLGLLASPSEFPAILLPAIGLALFLMLIARPLAVWLTLLPFRYSAREVAFTSWVGLRGAVSILLGIVPFIAGLPEGHLYFNVAFVVVVVSLLIQGWSIGFVARRLGLIVPPQHGPLHRTELELPGGGDHEIVGYRVHPESRVAKGERIPRWARPSLILRDGRSLRPHTAGRIRAGDQVYIVTATSYMPLLDQLFAGPAESAFDPQLYGEFLLDPAARLADVAATYDAEVPATEADLTLREFLRRRLHGNVEPGDRVGLGRFDIIVRAVDASHNVTEVGLGVEPAAAHPVVSLPPRSAALIARMARPFKRRRSAPAAVMSAPAATAAGADGEPANGPASSPREGI